MICSVHSLGINGIHGSAITVECYISNGLPAFDVVGLPDAAVKEAAIREASVIAQNILKETNIESLVQSKGFSECVAYIHDDACTIVVNGDVEDAQNALILRDIAVTETGFAVDQIRIISAS